MTREDLTDYYLSSGWEIWEEHPRTVQFRRGGLIATIVECREDDWRSGSLRRAFDPWGRLYPDA